MGTTAVQAIDINLEEDPTVVNAVPGDLRLATAPPDRVPVVAKDLERNEREAVIKDWRATLIEDFGMPKSMVDNIEWAVSIRIAKRRRL